MGSSVQIIILAIAAIFMILKLRGVLGTREGFEAPPEKTTAPEREDRFGLTRPLQAVKAEMDEDITDHFPATNKNAKALHAMKQMDGRFNVAEFLGGARKAYEWIIVAFESDDLETLQKYLAEDVYKDFASAIKQRQKKGYRVEADFIGVRKMDLKEASFDKKTALARIGVAFVGELSSVVLDAKDKVVEGDKKKLKKQKDLWYFVRDMKADNPNWRLAETSI